MNHTLNTATHRCSHSSDHSHRSLSLNSVDTLISNSLPNVLNISCKTSVFSYESGSRTTLNGLCQLKIKNDEQKSSRTTRLHLSDELRSSQQECRATVYLTGASVGAGGSATNRGAEPSNDA